MELNKVFEKYFIPSNTTLTENYSVCKTCGGQCCKNMGCHISPFDLKEITKESIIGLIEETGCISIDWWEGNPITGLEMNTRYYFLRMRNKGAKVIDASFGGHPCSVLTDTGCPILFQYRPKGARDLIPSKNEKGACNDKYSKAMCAKDWMPYRELLDDIYRYYCSIGQVTHTSLGDIMELIRMVIGDEE